MSLGAIRHTGIIGASRHSIGLLLVVGAASAATAQPRADRHFDARAALARPAPSASSAVVEAGLRRLRSAVPDLAVTRSGVTGGVRSLSSHSDYLTGESGFDPLFIGLEFVRANSDVFGLSEDDLRHRVADRVHSAVTGATRIYLEQMHRGIPVYNGQLQFNVNREGRLLSVHNGFVPGIGAAVSTGEPVLDLAGALAGAAAHAGLAGAAAPRLLSPARGPQRVTTLARPAVSREPVVGRLAWLPVAPGRVTLVWRFQIHTPDEQHAFDYTVDAVSAQVWTRVDWVASDSYRVYELPVESPNHTTPAPPSDGRVLVADPADATASPFGWHDTNGVPGAEFTVTRGNNVHAYTDVDANNSPDPGSDPSGGAGLDFDFGLNLTLAPSSYRPAAVTNLFYLNNVIHDVQLRYGFDEAAGNFQQTNYGPNGLGNDYVRAEAQDGSGVNNANFLTLPDGLRPRMQMFVWTAPSPDKDGDLDASIVVHEYGHGISNRLVGGPSNVSCLGNRQQPGEGLSDWWALVYTARPGDSGPDGRGIGTYALNQPTTGGGIRTQRYSTDPAINTWTYASVAGSAVPHGVGEKWAQAAWEVYWALVDAHGFDPDLHNATGGAGNQRAMLYVNEGLKNTNCSPTFTDVRDGIVEAALDSFGGEDVCRIWEAFAGFGLGVDAVSGGPNSTTPSNGFDVPLSCQGNQAPVADAGPDQSVAPGATVTLDGSGSSDPDSGPSPLSYAWTQLTGPAVTLTGANSVAATFTPTVEDVYSFRLTVDDGELSDSDDTSVTVSEGGGGPEVVFFDDFESDQGWTTNPSGTDTATTGRWERGDPQPTGTLFVPLLQLGDTVSGSNDLVTGRLAGSSVGANDIDNGVTSIRSPAIALPSGGTLTLSFSYYLAHLANASSADFLRVSVVGSSIATVFQELGAANADPGVWDTASVNIDAFAGQTVRILIAAGDVSTGSLVEAGIDDVKILKTDVGAGDVFFDDFESDQGWTTNPSGTDTATTGRWERGDPQPTGTFFVPLLQLGDTVSGSNDLVTGRLAGSSAGANDIDNGVTSIRSPAIALPSGGTLTLSFSYYLAHLANASSADFLRVSVVGSSIATVFQELGAANADPGVWDTASVNIDAFAGQTVRILIAAGDVSTGSLVEAGIDDVRIRQD